MRARAIRIASIRLLLLSLFSLSLVALSAPTVWALPDLSESGSFVRTLCEGDCTGLGTVPDGVSDFDFDFGLGLQAVGDGLSINLIAGGNVYVVGPIEATGDVHLTALGDMIFSTEIPDGVLAPPIAGGIHPPGLVIGPAPPIPAGSGGFISVAGADDSNGVASRHSSSEFDFTFNTPGDVYLDVSRVVLSSLRLKTLKVLVVSNDPLKPPVVPEPGTGVLLALGLLALGFRKAHLTL